MKDQDKAAQSQPPVPRVGGNTSEELIGAIARGWCAPENAGKEMDSDLAFAIGREVAAHLAGQSQATKVQAIDLMRDLMRFECVLTPEGKAEMYASETGPYVWFDHVISTLAAPTAQEVTQQAAPTAWLATDLDGRGDVAFTKEEAKRRAGEGCTEFFPLYDVALPPSRQRRPSRQCRKSSKHCVN